MKSFMNIYTTNYEQELSHIYSKTGSINKISNCNYNNMMCRIHIYAHDQEKLRDKKRQWWEVGGGEWTGERKRKMKKEGKKKKKQCMYPQMKVTATSC